MLILFDKKFYLPFDILTKVDRASMASSLETRAPLLDFRISEMASQISIGSKIKKHGLRIETKWILRQVLGKYIPDNLINRKKRGFSLPINNWLRGPLRPMTEELISQKKS